MYERDPNDGNRPAGKANASRGRRGTTRPAIRVASAAAGSGSPGRQRGRLQTWERACLHRRRLHALAPGKSGGRTGLSRGVRRRRPEPPHQDVGQEPGGDGRLVPAVFGPAVLRISAGPGEGAGFAVSVIVGCGSACVGRQPRGSALGSSGRSAPALRPRPRRASMTTLATRRTGGVGGEPEPRRVRRDNSVAFARRRVEPSSRSSSRRSATYVRRRCSAGKPDLVWWRSAHRSQPQVTIAIAPSRGT
jgi:hypothetical protein